MHGDKGYDSDAVRRKIETMGAATNIQSKATGVPWQRAFRVRRPPERHSMSYRSAICELSSNLRLRKSIATDTPLDLLTRDLTKTASTPTGNSPSMRTIRGDLVNFSKTEPGSPLRAKIPAGRILLHPSVSHVL
jgi:hypothetical protein